ncbi:MAG: hypothetical protein RML14_11895 [Meiothermus sp.]|uniref:hypothetical protein n=1 Tax=Meiothermus sp. TaxID=1955249 RepID=UPI00298F0358|nr:hypothetical protein [Meiothermus sp.]MDW8482539.1 hypothetical protein [Meiothermus sp.]
MKKLRWTTLLILLGLPLTACPSVRTQAQGQLEVTITGLPPDVDADVRVEGPGGYSRPLSRSTNPPLEVGPGNYTVTANDVSAAGETYSAKVSPPGNSNTATVSVAAGQKTQVTVAYAKQTPSPPPSGEVNPEKTFAAPFGIGSLAFLGSPGDGQGRLYGTGNAANKDDPSARFYLTPADLGGSGGSVPSGQIADEAGLYHLTFAADGTLYELKRDDLPPEPRVYIRRYARSTAVNNQFTPTPLVITNGAFSFSVGSSTIQDYNLYSPTDMALDAAGNLWVLDPQSTARANSDGILSPPGRLVCYSAADQAGRISTTGNLDTPGRVYYGSAVEGMRALAFDAEGNLWLAGGSGASARLVRVAAGTLSCPDLNPTTQNPANAELATNSPGVTVLSGPPLAQPVDLAIAGPDLYVAQPSNILKLSTSSTNIPADLRPITIAGLQGQITALAVDGGGKLWVSTAGAPAPSPGRIYKLP